MSKTEDYLDSLLNNVTPERKAESKRKRRKRKTNYEEDFENELSGVNEGGLGREFEADTGVKNTDDSFFDDLEGIINKINEPLTEEPEPPKEPEEDVFEINTLADDAWTEELQAEEPYAQEPQPEVDLVGDADSLDELLEAEGSGGDGGAAGTDEEKEPGFFKKLGAALFGKGGDALAEEETPASAEASEDGEYGGLDDEQLQILQELNMADSVGMPEPSDEQEKGKKKKEKKMKKEKKAKEKKPKEKKPKKVKKPKKEKPKKEKAPKKPKPVDLSPPLPKAPVALIFIMAISAGAFVLISSNLMGYSSSITAAKAAYTAQDYVEAYRQMAGVEPKAEDEELNGRITLLAGVQGEISKGNSLYENGQYTMALDAYICALGRYDANYGEAALYNAEAEYDVLASQAEAQMSEKFGVSAETAREIYGLSDRTEYTYRIYQIVKGLGLQ